MVLFADTFSPAIFNVMGPVGWVPSVDLYVQLCASPAPGFIQAVTTTRYLTDGVLEEDGEYCDSSGQLVAISRQMARLRR